MKNKAQETLGRHKDRAKQEVQARNRGYGQARQQQSAPPQQSSKEAQARNRGYGKVGN